MVLKITHDIRAVSIFEPLSCDRVHFIDIWNLLFILTAQCVEKHPWVCIYFWTILWSIALSPRHETYFCSSCPMRSVDKHPYLFLNVHRDQSHETYVHLDCRTHDLFLITFELRSVAVKIWNRSSVTHFWFTIWITRAYNHIWNRICLLFICVDKYPWLSIYFLSRVHLGKIYPTLKQMSDVLYTHTLKRYMKHGQKLHTW